MLLRAASTPSAARGCANPNPNPSSHGSPSAITGCCGHLHCSSHMRTRCHSYYPSCQQQLCGCQCQGRLGIHSAALGLQRTVRTPSLRTSVLIAMAGNGSRQPPPPAQLSGVIQSDGFRSPLPCAAPRRAIPARRKDRATRAPATAAPNSPRTAWGGASPSRPYIHPGPQLPLATAARRHPEQHTHSSQAVPPGSLSCHCRAPIRRIGGCAASGWRPTLGQSPPPISAPPSPVSHPTPTPGRARAKGREGLAALDWGRVLPGGWGCL